MKPTQTKGLAIACLMLAIAATALAFWCSEKALRIQGPFTLLQMPDDTLWVGVDDELWVFDRNGTRQTRKAMREIGLPGDAARLARHPSGAVVATVTDDSTLHVIDVASLQVVRQLTPQWPADLARHGGRAIHLAIDDDGRFAIATGGGHAVALFAPDGRFIARSAPGQYEFTNGLWWTRQGLWTTDTNRGQLWLLDGQTLASLRSVRLPPGGALWGLGTALPHPAGADTPLAALIRFGNDRIQGRVVDVLADGSERPYPHESRMEPRDLAWHQGALLVADGASQSVLRWSSDRTAMAPFGDATSLADLRQRVTDKKTYSARYEHLLYLAGAFFLAGLGLAVLAQRQQEHRPVAAAARAPRRATGRGWHPVLASAIVPGLGQWMQRRNAVALLLFLGWAGFTLAATVPLVWSLYGPRTAVASEHVAQVALLQLAIALIAATDAWRHQRT